MKFNILINEMMIKKILLGTVFIVVLHLLYLKRTLLYELIRKVYKKIENIVRILFGNCMLIFCRVFAFFKSKKFLLIIVLANILISGSTIAIKNTEREIPWILVIGFMVVSVMIGFAWYIEPFFEWCKKSHYQLGKSIDFCMNFIFYFAPIGYFCSSVYLSNLYFEEELIVYELATIIILILLMIIHVIYYCAELLESIRKKYELKVKIIFFTFILIHIVQIFANMYILLIAVDHNSFSNVVTENAFSICFDLTYFSAMTMLTGNSAIIPETMWAKLLVMIESLILTVYISVIVLGIFANEKEKENG